MGKKLRERLAREEAAGIAGRVKKSLLWKIFRFSFKSLYVLLFLFYLMMGTGMTYGWVMTKWYRHYPPEYAGELCKKYATSRYPDPDKIVHWVVSRRASEADIIMEKMESCTPFLPSAVFLTFANWKYQLGKMEEGLNWRQYARFRARFDALRCGSPDAPEQFNNLLDLSSRDDVQEMMEKNPSLQPKSIRWALEHDAKYPPPQNDVAELCHQLTAPDVGEVRFRPVTREHWGDIHATLRAMSYFYISMMEKDIAAGGRGVIEHNFRQAADPDTAGEEPAGAEKEDNGGKKE